MTCISETLVDASNLLRTAGVPDARRDAASLLAHITGHDKTFLLTHPRDEIDIEVLETYERLVRRRASGEPLQYITGRQEFFSLDFVVTPDVLIPRPETELLVEAALAILQSADIDVATPLICDVGTGSGCISIAILKTLQDARAIGLDISIPALLNAMRNARRHKVEQRFKLLASDCFAALNESREMFTLIVSNPPYVSQNAMPGLQREVRDYEPRVALTPGGDGLGVIRKLLTESPKFLVPRGYLLFEIGFDQHDAVNQHVDSAVWELLDIHKDLQGIPRTVALRRV